MKLVVIVSVLLSVTGVLSACATDASKVEERVQQEKPARDHGELAARGFEAWASSTEIDLDQKSKLWKLHSATGREAYRFRDEITKTKSALFKELAKGNYDQNLVNGFKTKIVSLDQDRLGVMFKALSSVEAILGRGDKAGQYYLYLEKMESRAFDGP